MPSTLDKKQLTAALATPDTDVGIPSRREAGSLSSQITALEAGDCAAKPILVDSSMSLADYALNGATLRDNLRSSVKSSVRLAQTRTGGTYIIEVSDMITTAGRLYLVAVITRTE